MVKLDIYAIVVETDDRGRPEIVELHNSFEDCMKNRMKYANWWRVNGDVWIWHIPGGNNLDADEEWHIDEDGSIVSHYKWRKK